MYNETTRNLEGTGYAPPSKEVRTPEETVQLAIKERGKGVLYSKGHTQASARSKAKRIRKGKPRVWGQWEGQIRTGAYKQLDGTWSIYVGWIGGDENGRKTGAMLSDKLEIVSP